MAFSRTWIGHWWREQLFRKRLWPGFEVHQENQQTFCASLKASFWNLCSAVAIDWGFTYLLRKTAIISPRLSLVGLLKFLNVCDASPFKKECKKLILSSSVSWSWNLGLFWKRSSNSSNFSHLSLNVGILCKVFKDCRLAVVCQLLKGQKNLVCFNYLKGVLTAKLWLNYGACLLFFSWSVPWGATSHLFLNSSHHVSRLVRV